MNRRATLVLLLVAALLGTFLALTRTGTLTLIPEDEEAGEDEFAVVTLFEATETEPVVAFSITDNATGDRFAAQIDDVVWTIAETPVEPEEGQVVDVVLLEIGAGSLSTMTSARQLSALENLGQYGLETANYTLEFTTEGGSDFALDIGGLTPQGTHYYTQRRGEDLINLVSAPSLDVFINYLTQPPYAEPTPEPEPTLES